MIKTEVKEAWTQALRSGKYDQGKHALRTKDNKFCCLGVLCDISNVGVWALQGDGSYRYKCEGYNNNSGEGLPIAVQDWAGIIGTSNPVLKQNDFKGLYSAAGLNDDGTPFFQIADLIESAAASGVL